MHFDAGYDADHNAKKHTGYRVEKNENVGAWSQYYEKAFWYQTPQKTLP